MRSVGPLGTAPGLSWIGVSSAGYIVAYLDRDKALRCWTVNGEAVATKDFDAKQNAFAFSTDGAALVVGGDDGVARCLWVHSLLPAGDGPRAGHWTESGRLEAGISAFAWGADELSLAVGHVDGGVTVLEHEEGRAGGGGDGKPVFSLGSLEGSPL